VNRPVHLRCWIRRVLNLKASESTIADVRLVLMYMERQGVLLKGSLGRMPLSSLTERQARRLIKQCRLELRKHIWRQIASEAAV
jgi:hypothetical protein